MAQLQNARYVWDERSAFKKDALYFGILNKPEFIYAKQLTQQMLLDLHKHIMHKTNPLIAGEYRRTDIEVCEHIAVPWEEVPAKMTEFVDWYNSHEHTTDLLSLTAEVHYRLTYIHPFFDGNGRCCRLLSNFVLARNGFGTVIFDEEMRKDYNATLTHANKSGGPGARTLDLVPFTNLYAHLIQNAEFY